MTGSKSNLLNFLLHSALPLLVLAALAACDFQEEITPVDWPTPGDQPFEATSSAPTLPFETPVMTPATQPTAPPIPTPTAYPEMYVSVSGLRLRDAPGLGSNILMELDRSTVVRIIGSPIYVEGDDWTWLEVELEGGQRGFVAFEYLSSEIPAIGWSDNAPLSGSGLDQTGHGHGTPVTQGLHPGLDIASGDATVRANTEGRLYMYQTWNDDEGWHVQRYDADDAQDNADLDGFGNYVVMETEINGETYYQVMAHLDGFTPGLRQGQQVQAGTVLGTMGETGYTDGPHVHWEIRRDDAVRTLDDGTHIFDVYYAEDETELDELFVDPDEFAEWLD